MDRFKIFPSIGIARVGGSLASIFLCPEKSDSIGIDIDSTGNESALQNFKDANGLIKRQGARFKVYELDNATQQYEPVDMNTVSVKWEVHLANKKAGVERDGGPPPDAPTLPLSLRNGFENLIIDPGPRSIQGKNVANVLFDNGKFKNNLVFLGELRTDKDSNVIVLGGHGKSRSPGGKPIQNFYYSDDWHDDTSDGFVKATVTLTDGTSHNASDAWVIIGPPDFAPKVQGLVTLYDVIEQVAIDNNLSQRVLPPSFVHQILPLIQRYKNLKWVSTLDAFDIQGTDAALADTSPAAQATRVAASEKIKSIESVLTDFDLTSYQHEVLSAYENGTFTNDLIAPGQQLSAPNQLTKVVLDTTVGQGFYPGIEGGIIVKSKDIYKEAFRFDSSKLKAGDVTGLMAVPWQADFLKCAGAWWPSQRPDSIVLNSGARARWQRPITNSHTQLIANFDKLGFVKPNGANQTEQERTEFV